MEIDNIYKLTKEMYDSLIDLPSLQISFLLKPSFKLIY